MSDDTAMALAIAADQLSEAHKRIAKLEAFVAAYDDYIAMEGYSWNFARMTKMGKARKALEAGE